MYTLNKKINDINDVREDDDIFTIAEENEEEDIE